MFFKILNRFRENRASNRSGGRFLNHSTVMGRINEPQSNDNDFKHINQQLMALTVNQRI